MTAEVPTDVEMQAALSGVSIPLWKAVNELAERVGALEAAPSAPPDPTPPIDVDPPNLQEAFNDAPDGGMVRVTESGVLAGTVTISRNVGMEFVPGVELTDMNASRGWLDKACFVTRQETIKLKGVRIKGPRTLNPTGRSGGFTFHSTQVAAEDCHLRDFTRSGFGHFNQASDSVYVRCSATSMYRDDGSGYLKNGYGWEVNGDGAAWNRPLRDSNGRAIDLVRLYDCRGDDSRHAIAANGAARYGVYGGEYSQRESRDGALLDAHGKTEHWRQVSTHYIEIVGANIHNAWAGVGPRGGIVRVTGCQIDCSHDLLMMIEQWNGETLPEGHIQDAHMWDNHHNGTLINSWDTNQPGASKLLESHISMQPPEEGFKYFETPEALVA